MEQFVARLEVARWGEVGLWLGFFTLGVPGNLLILGVYRSKRVRTSTHVLIIALAVADLLTCLLRGADAVMLASVSEFLAYDSQSVVYFLSRGFLFATAFLTTAIAYDRYDAVCRSLRRRVTLPRAKGLAAASFAGGFGVTLPELYFTIIARLRGEKLTLDTKSVVRFIPVIVYLLSVSVVVVAYCAIFAFMRRRPRVGAGAAGREPAAASSAAGPGTSRLWITPVEGGDLGGESSARPDEPKPTAACSAAQAGRSRGAGRRPPSRASGQSRTTKMLFVTTFVFFVLWLPEVLLNMYAQGSMRRDVVESSSLGSLVVALVILKEMAYFNSVVNAFIYGLANKRFRDDCRSVIGRLRRVRP